MEPKNNNTNLEDALRQLVAESATPEAAGKTISDLLNKIQKENQEAKEKDKKRGERNTMRAQCVKRVSDLDKKLYKEYTLEDAIAMLVLALDNSINDWTAKDMRNVEQMLNKAFKEGVDACNSMSKIPGLVDSMRIDAEDALEHFFKVWNLTF